MRLPPIPTLLAERSSRLWSLAAAAGLVGIVILYTFDPSSHGFYPRCWLYATTGWQCPGCGGLRAAHCLLHGRLGDALRFNPLLVCLLPVSACFVLNHLVRSGHRESLPPRFKSSVWLWLLGGITIAFGVVRNLI